MTKRYAHVSEHLDEGMVLTMPRPALASFPHPPLSNPHSSRCTDFVPVIRVAFVITYDMTSPDAHRLTTTGCRAQHGYDPARDVAARAPCKGTSHFPYTMTTLKFPSSLSPVLAVFLALCRRSYTPSPFTSSRITSRTPPSASAATHSPTSKKHSRSTRAWSPHT